MPRPARDAEERLYTKREIAEKCRVDERTVSRWIKDGKLEAIHLGGPHGRVRISETAFLKFLAAGRRTKRGAQKLSK
jgi:excisionase family DNA binding protein